MSFESPKFFVTIEAPDWALDGGFPEDMPFTNSSDLPDNAECVEPYVVDGRGYVECQIFKVGDSYHKVELEGTNE